MGLIYFSDIHGLVAGFWPIITFPFSQPSLTHQP
jgi:hypothetical protein